MKKYFIGSEKKQKNSQMVRNTLFNFIDFWPFNSTEELCYSWLIFWAIKRFLKNKKNKQNFTLKSLKKNKCNCVFRKYFKSP